MQRSVRSIAMIVGPSIFSLTFAFFIAPGRPLHLPGAPWYMATFMLLVAVAVAPVVAPKTAPPPNKESEIAETQPGLSLLSRREWTPCLPPRGVHYTLSRGPLP